jgi:hypothetical protein
MPFPTSSGWPEMMGRENGATSVFGVNMLGDTQYGYRAQCVVAEPVLTSDDFGRVTNKKDPSIDKARYRIGIVQSGLDKVRALGPQVQRLVVVHGEDQLVTNVSMEGLRAAEGRIVMLTLVEF